MVSMKSPTKLINLHHLTIALVVILGVLTHRSQCAPAVEEDDVEGGCYYMFNHYGEGDRILTNEPCLNCTCHNSMLMCYLRVCPFTKPIGQDCTIEKKPDQCCPVINCPQVPVSLVTPSALVTTTSTTTAATVPSSELATLERGCEMDGKYYADGAQVASDANKPCELCYCIRNRTACVMQECILHVEGCRPVFEPGVCCPVRYQCDAALDYDTTTTAAGIGGLISTTISSIIGGISSTPQPGGCVKDGEYYADGSLIPHLDDDPCNHCYCMRGDIVCAVQECGSPLENEGGNCTAVPPRAGLCCPEQYACPGSTSRQGKVFLHSKNENMEVPDGVTTQSSAGLETVTPSLISSSSPSQVQSERVTVVPNVPQGDEEEGSTSSAVSGESNNNIPTSTEASSLEAEATTVHVAIVKPDEGAPIEGQTSLPSISQQDESDEERTTTPRVSNTSPLTIHEVFPEQPTSQPAGVAENLLSTTSAPASVAADAGIDDETTGRPAEEQEVSEKVGTAPAGTGAAEPQTTSVPEVAVEGSSQGSSSTGTSADMVLTTTPHGIAQDGEEQVTSSLPAEQSPVSSSSVPQTTSTEIVASTPLPEQQEEATEASAVNELESSSVGPVETSSGAASSSATDSPLSDAGQTTQEHIIHMTTPREELPADHESATDIPASVPEASSASPSSDAAETTGEEATAVPSSAPETTPANEATSSSSTAEPVTEAEPVTTSQPASEQDAETSQSSTSTTAAPSVSLDQSEEAQGTTQASVDKVVEEIGLTTLLPLSPSSSEAAEAAGSTEPSIAHDENEPVTTASPSESESVKEAASVTSSSIAPASETSGAATASATDDSSKSPEATTLPSAGVEEHTLNSISADAAASSVATERIPTTVIGIATSEQSTESNELKPQTEASSSVAPGVGSSSAPETVTSSSTSSEPSSQASAGVPSEGQETTASSVNIEDRISQGAGTTAKPAFIIASTEGHMVIIPEQAPSQQHIPVMPLQRENQTSTASPATEENLSSTAAASESPSFLPDHHDDSENDIGDHAENEHSESPQSSVPVEVTTPKLSVSSSETPADGEQQEASTIVSVQQSSPSSVAPQEGSSSPAAPEEAPAQGQEATTVAAGQEEHAELTTAPASANALEEQAATTSAPEQTGIASSAAPIQDQPESTSAPAQEEQSGSTAQPAQSEQQGSTAEPSQPGSTAQPAQSEQQGSTSEPAEPEQLGSTAQPAQSEQPEPTVQPAQSEQQQPTAQPAQSEQPGSTAQPAQSEQPEPTAQPAESEQPESTAQPGQSEQPGSTSQPAQSEKPEPTSQPAQEEQSGSTAQPEQEEQGTNTQSGQEGQIGSTSVPAQDEQSVTTLAPEQEGPAGATGVPSQSQTQGSEQSVATSAVPQQQDEAVATTLPAGVESQPATTVSSTSEEQSATTSPSAEKEQPASAAPEHSPEAAATTITPQDEESAAATTVAPTENEAEAKPAVPSEEPVAVTTSPAEQEIVATTVASQSAEQASSSPKVDEAPEATTTRPDEPAEVSTTASPAKPETTDEESVATTPAKEEQHSTSAPAEEPPAADQTHDEEPADAATTVPSAIAPAGPSEGADDEQLLTTPSSVGEDAAAQSPVQTTIVPVSAGVSEGAASSAAPAEQEPATTIAPADEQSADEQSRVTSPVAAAEVPTTTQESESSEGPASSSPSSVESGSTSVSEDHVELTTNSISASEQEESSTPSSSASSSSSSSSGAAGSTEPVTTEESKPSSEGVTSTESSENQSSTENSISSSSSSAQSDETIEATTVGSLEVQEVSTTNRNNLVTSNLVGSGSDESSSATTESEEVVLTDAPGVRIPGEGSCFVEGVSYRNGSHIPPSTPCQITCACQNSIVHCLLYHCAPAPSDLNCKPIYKPNVCCPEYDCEPSSTVVSVTILPEATPAPITPENAENLVSGSTASPISAESTAAGVNETAASTSAPEIITVQPGKPQESPEISNLAGAPTQGPSGAVDEVVVTTPQTVPVTSEPSTSVHSQTEVSLVSSSASSSQVSSVSSVSGPTINGVAEASTQTSSPAAATQQPNIDEKLGTASAVELTPAAVVTTTIPSTSAGPEQLLSSSQSPSASQVTASENEIIPSAETTVANTSAVTSAGSKYPVTTTTSVTSSPAPWPYPSSSTMAPSVSSGACLFDGRVYMSAQQIPRDDPCDFCFCFRGDIICLQQSCPPPIPGCYEEPIPGFCCPRYECPVGSGNSTTTPPLFPPSYYHGQIMNGAGGSPDKPGISSSQMASGPGCEIQGEYYETGQVIMATSGPCLECRCGSTGMMECDPRECQPEPMLRKMIAAISSR